MRRVLFAVPLLLLSARAEAAPEWLVVRWLGPNQRCEVLNYRPPFGNFEEVARFRLKKEADRALDAQVRLHKCRAIAKKAPVVPAPEAEAPPQPPKAR